MSVYQQPFHPTYSRYPYQQQQSVPAQQYSYQQPSSLVYNDPNVFRRDFATRLSELTVNNKNMIHGLSFIAHDNARFGDIVVQCLEAHIRRVPPWMKLPSFYLLDAMSKNIFDLYASKFSAVVVSLFLDSWREVDSTTRSKMEEMLVTWRTGAPNGKELFGIAPQVTIERTIWGNDASSSTSTVTSRRFPHSSPTITKSQVLAELEVTLAHKEKQVQINPYDATSRSHIHVLHQLRNLVDAGVSQEELAQILQQLRVLTKEAVQVPPPPPPPPTMSTPTPNSYSSSSVTSPSQTYSSSFVSSNAITVQPQTSLSSLPVQSSSSSAPSNSVPTVSADVTTNISALFNTLVKAGLVSVPKSGTPVANAVATSSADEKPAEVDHALEASREYCKAMQNIDIKLSAPDIAKRRTTYLSFLYEHQPLQCKQCALRFPNNPPGKKKMEDHLDMHFRQNRKSSQNIGRGHSRSWFIGAKSWMHEFDNEKGKGRVTTTKENGQNAVANDNLQREAELRASFVVVPPGDEAKNASCPICKETLSPEFLEDDEEWVWRNAIRVKEKIFHATCHAEIKSTNALASRLRNEAGHSRSATPDLPDRPKILSPAKLLAAKLRASRSPTPDRVLAGLKRKVGEDETEIMQHHEDSPPTKKTS